MGRGDLDPLLGKDVHDRLRSDFLALGLQFSSDLANLFRLVDFFGVGHEIGFFDEDLGTALQHEKNTMPLPSDQQGGSLGGTSPGTVLADDS